MRPAFRRPEFSPRGWSLRTRLVVLLIGLAVVGLAAADFASYRALHNYLYDRVDQQLESAVVPVSIALDRMAGGEEALGAGPGLGGAGPARAPDSQLPPGTFGQLRNAA